VTQYYSLLQSVLVLVALILCACWLKRRSIVTALIAWIIGTAMGLGRRVLGSVVLVTGVGSSSTLGYSLIHQ
jgi:hypothetical protein